MVSRILAGACFAGSGMMFGGGLRGLAALVFLGAVALIVYGETLDRWLD